MDLAVARTMRQLLWAALLLGLFGCTDADNGPPCAVSVSLSGYITATMPEEITCGGRIGAIELLFQPEAEGHPIGGFLIVVEAVERGETGDFPATITVFGAEGGVFETDTCSVTIEEHRNLGQVCYHEGHGIVCEDVDNYRVRGRGECRTPARDPTGVPVTVGPFEFSAEMWWPR